MDSDFICSRYHGAVRASAFVGKKPKNSTTSQAIVSEPKPKNQLIVPATINFIEGAKIYKKQKLNNALLQGVTEALYIVLGFVLILSTIGLVLNLKYHNRALPFTYVGDVSVGGMNKTQIIDTLNSHFNNIKITLVEGGLVRSVSLKQLGIAANTITLSNQIIHQRVSPLSYINWQRYSVPIFISQKIIAGYVQQVINPTQTESTDASLAVVNNKLTIQPAVVGFQTDASFVANQIQLALAQVSAPIINVNAVTIKPHVYTSDLTNYLTQANQLLQTPIVIKDGYIAIKPTYQQKLAWLQINQTLGSKLVSFSFSQGLVRSYIINQVNRLQKNVTSSNSVAINNIDAATNSVINDLNSGNAANSLVTLSLTNNNLVSASATETPTVAAD